MHAHMPHTREGEKGKFFRNQEMGEVGGGVSNFTCIKCLLFAIHFTKCRNST